MRDVPEHVTAIEGHHGNEVGEPEQQVDPDQPEKQVDEDQHAVDAKHVGHHAVVRHQETLFDWMDGHALELKRHENQAQRVDGGGDKPLGESRLNVGRKRAGQSVDADGSVGHLLDAEEGIPRFNAVRVELRLAPSVVSEMFAFVAQPCLGRSRFTVEVHHREAHCGACFEGSQCFGEGGVIDDWRVVDGDDSVPRFQSCFFRPRANDHATDVNAVLRCSELTGQATQQEQEDQGGEDVRRRAGRKHPQAFTAGCLQQFFGLGFSKGAER